MISKILILAGISVVMYLVIFVNAKVSRRTRAYLVPILIIATAGLFGALLLLLGGPNTFDLVGVFVIAICATLLIVVLEMRKLRKGRQQQRGQ